MSEGIICAHCEYKHEEWWEFIDPTTEEAEFEMACDACNKNFKVDMYTKITFDTTLI